MAIVNAITDFMLGFGTLILAFQLGGSGDQSKRYWLQALTATGIGAILGSIHFAFDLSASNNDLIVEISYLMILLASMLMLTATAYSTMNSNLRNLVLTFAFVEFIVFAYYLIYVNLSFNYVIMDYVPAMLIVIILHLLGKRIHEIESTKFIITGILVSFLAAGLQIGLNGILNIFINNNDVFHLIQLIAIYFIYRGAQLSRVLEIE